MLVSPLSSSSGRVFLHPSSVNFSCGGCTATLYVHCNELSVFRGVRKCCMGQQALGLIAAAAATHGTVHPSKACNTFLLSCAAGKFESGWLAYSEIVETSKVGSAHCKHCLSRLLVLRIASVALAQSDCCAACRAACVSRRGTAGCLLPLLHLLSIGCRSRVHPPCTFVAPKWRGLICTASTWELSGFRCFSFCCSHPAGVCAGVEHGARLRGAAVWR